MISAAISAIAVTFDVSFVIILSKIYQNSPSLPFMRLKAHRYIGIFVRPLMVRPLSLRRATENPQFRSTSFALAAQHVKFNKNSTLFIWLGLNLLHRNEFDEE